MADAEIYARRLLVKRHGYPLWVPEPYGQSAIYETKGVRIGDVGFVTRDGGFRALFNIRASPEDPINWQGVPDGFQQIRLGPWAISHIPNFHPPDSFVTSTSAAQRSFGVGASAPQAQTIVSAGAALQYVWTSTEGGILHLPKGAERFDTKLKRTFQEQAIRHAKNWYKFAYECSDISNGALYLITGCDKTNSWMVGAFSDCASGSQVILQLNAIAGALEGQLSYSYSWATSSPASHRVGPSNEVRFTRLEDLDNLFRDDEIFATDATEGNNQCTFIRGFKITLRPDLWRRILRRPTFIPQITSIEDATEKDVMLNSATNPGTVSASHSIGKAKASSEEWDGEPGCNSLSDPGDDVGLEGIPDSFECCHPSTVINNFMLEKYADAEVAITHDDDWIHLIDEVEINHLKIGNLTASPHLRHDPLQLISDFQSFDGKPDGYPLAPLNNDDRYYDPLAENKRVAEVPIWLAPGLHTYTQKLKTTADVKGNYLPGSQHSLNFKDDRETSIRPTEDKVRSSEFPFLSHQVDMDDTNVSVFGSLVDKEYPHETPNAQQMRPEVSRLVKELTYLGLDDTPSTQGRPHTCGLRDNIIFIDHRHPEDSDPEIAGRFTTSMKCQNSYEVAIVVEIVHYLTQQGYGADSMVVLTPYLGQLNNLLNELKRDMDPILNDLDLFDLAQAGLVTQASAKLTKKSIRLATIDNYHGEESDIIIISLTRSNPNNDIGSMFSPECLNVLLSHARDGLIILGNATTYTHSKKGGELWSKLIDLLRSGGHLYEGLPVKCERHPSQIATLVNTDDFDTLCPDGGCTAPWCVYKVLLAL
ncbi:hypothetical protein EYR38_009713 [Pleurotus pulmonarius]|nr:hypothetical protein EYR38_010392 [Pleurotus pulmonarius]KAF4590413.1 hypothetical protein EYR38_009713 [Pleurotus pulmonarius]